MTDVTAALAGHTKKYNIPLSHFEHKYIQNCTNGKELEKIYKELIGGEVGSFPELERLTLNRIHDVKPNSQILRKDEPPPDRSALPADEREQLDDFLSQVKELNKAPSTAAAREPHNNGVSTAPIRNTSAAAKSIIPAPTASVINKNGKQKRVMPRSYDEWGKLDQKLSKEADSGSESEPEPTERKPVTAPQPANPAEDKAQRLRSAEEHRLKGNAAFKSNSFQQAIEHYTNSVSHDDTNSVVYMNRAIAHYKLSNYDASTSDCSKVLTNDPSHIKALFRRASCCLAKHKYEEAKRDLEKLLSIDSSNTEAQNLLKTIPPPEKPKGVRIPITEDDGEADETPSTPAQASAPTSVKIPIQEVDEEEEEEDEEEATTTMQTQPPPIFVQPESPAQEPMQSISIDIPPRANSHARPCIGSQDASPAMFDHHFHHRDDMHQFQQTVHSQLSNLNTDVHDDDEDDDMVLGDEAGGDLIGNMSDDDGHVSRSMNVSPTGDGDGNDDVPELVDHQTFQPQSRPAKNTTAIDRSIAFAMNDTYRSGDFKATPHAGLYDDADDESPAPAQSNTYSPFKPTSTNLSSNARDANEKSTAASNNDQIANSNFSPIVQGWLRDKAKLGSSQQSSSLYDKLWTRSSRPHGLDRLQRDIDRFNRLNDCRNGIEAAKKMLKNGLLDYHHHADHIVSTLMVCAQCHAKMGNHISTVQYTTEALQYHKMDANVLICRARAFEAEKFLLFSYADYARIPSTDYNYALAQSACEKLIPDLIATEGANWREKLPQDTSDDERYLAFLKIRSSYSDSNQYEWYRERGNQLYMDACFILAIQLYTRCIDLKANVPFLYSNRAACYLKAFEPYKVIADCDKALALDPKNVRALYRKACAYKMSRKNDMYESTLEDLMKLEPNNQTILAEYYFSRGVSMPRERRRLRVHPPKSNDPPSTTALPSAPSSAASNTPKATVVEQTPLSYNDLEEIRGRSSPFSSNVGYQFAIQLSSLKADDIRGQCSLMLRVPTKALYKLANAASSKLVETMARAAQTMVSAEKRHVQGRKDLSLPFNYSLFCFQLLIQLTTLPRIESSVAMIDEPSRAALDDLLVHYASMPSVNEDVQKLDRLRK